MSFEINMKMRNKTNYKIAILTIAIFFLLAISGCKAPVKLSKVESIIPSQQWNEAIPMDSLPITRGLLDFFQDRRLKALVEEALNNNLDLKSTALRLEAASFFLKQSSALKFPGINISANKGRSNSLINPATGKHIAQNSHTLSMNISWELDLWGKIKDTHLADKSNFQMQAYEFKGLKDALAARVIQSYINLISSGRKIQLTHDILMDTEISNKSVRKKFKDGLAMLEELNQSNTELALARMEYRNSKVDYNKDKRTLEVLLGRIPETKIIAAVNFPEMESLPVKIPSVVLRNRPDIKAALSSVKANISFANSSKKAMLPGFNLSAEMFKNAAAIGDLSGATLIWNVIGSLTQPIFNGGRLRNEYKARTKNAEAAIIDLKQKVYSALIEVENALGYEKTLLTMETTLKTTHQYIIENKKIYEEKYNKGLVPFYVLLDVKKQANQSTLRLNEIKTNRLNNRIALALALGYGI